MLALNGVYCGDACEQLQKLPKDYIHLTLTSPPYGKMRTYGGHDFNFECMAKELHRVTAPGGVVVWVSGDALVKDSETGLSFRQALYFMELGFLLHDTMIYAKQNPLPRKQRRYQQQFEYMFVLSKGQPRVFNPIMEPCKYAGVKSTGRYYEQPDTAIPYRASKDKEKRIADTKVKGNVWTYWVGRNTAEEKKEKAKFYHPAKMNLTLARDHVTSWTNKGDIVLDPMCGSGTTLVAAKELGRCYIGMDICQDYAQMATDRLALVEELCLDGGEA